MYKFIHDISELEFFYENILPILTKNEVYFCSLSSRKKYLPENQRGILDGSSEMFERRLIEKKDWILFTRTLYRYECNEGAYCSSDGTQYPQDSMCIYFNFNPVDVIKAYEEFTVESTKNIMALALGRGSSPDYFKRLNHNVMTAMHHSRGTKHYIDIDIDFKPNTRDTEEGRKKIKEISEFLKAKELKFFVINSHSGYHILIKVNSLKSDVCSLLKIAFTGGIIKDIMNNAQGMIQLPGTLAAGVPIYVDKLLSSY